MIDRHLHVSLEDSTQAGDPVSKAVGRFLAFASEQFAVELDPDTMVARVDLEAAANAFIAKHSDRAAWLLFLLVRTWQEAKNAADEDDEGEQWKRGIPLDRD